MPVPVINHTGALSSLFKTADASASASLDAGKNISHNSHQQSNSCKLFHLVDLQACIYYTTISASIKTLQLLTSEIFFR